MSPDLHHLFSGDLSDAPGRCESWDEYVRYSGRGRWVLKIKGTDFSGYKEGENLVERMSTKRLIAWILDRDAEDKEASAYETSDGEGEGDDDEELKPRTLGPRAQRLLAIATSVGADHCVGRLRELAAEPREPYTPRILEVKGIVERRVHIRTGYMSSRYQNMIVYTVETTSGPAYLYPPRDDGTSHLLLRTTSDTYEHRQISLSKKMMASLAPFDQSLAELQAKKGA